MTATPRKLIASSYIGTSLATEYTANNVRGMVQNMTLTNRSASAVLVSVHAVESGGSAGASNVIIDDRAIQAGETYLCAEMAGKVLEPGDFIAAVADAGSAVVVNASGVEFT